MKGKRKTTPLSASPSTPVELSPSLTCKRCGHTWTPRAPTRKYCPECHSPYWWIEKGKLPQGAAAWRKTGGSSAKKGNDLRKSKKGH